MSIGRVKGLMEKCGLPINYRCRSKGEPTFREISDGSLSAMTKYIYWAAGSRNISLLGKLPVRCC
ncbi:hypothetical protein BS78_05G088300 [Paspalum vaginatum]|nr:hypothetical protein BS78_05G088300 [Paspalum vaginatum]